MMRRNSSPPQRYSLSYGRRVARTGAGEFARPAQLAWRVVRLAFGGINGPYARPTAGRGVEEEGEVGVVAGDGARPAIRGAAFGHEREGHAVQEPQDRQASER